MNSAAYQFSSAEREHFDQHGWQGPFALAQPFDAPLLADELQRCHGQTRGYFYPDPVEAGVSYYQDTPWFQSLHALSPTLCEVGQRPEIVERVAQLLAEDLLLWGGICFAQEPGAGFHWHTDTEFDHVEGVSIWLGLEGVTPETSLKIMPGSDRWPLTPEQFQQDGSLTMEALASDELALELARRAEPDASIVRPPLHDGEFFIFKGKTWHASDNFSDQRRVAMGLRYSPTSEKVLIPLSYLHPIQWDPTPPPCVLVAGEDHFGRNRLIDPHG